ncbi:MAG: hypothetical protein U9P10_08095, partial [Thermodesulfobacteriota bacterium]|nr:hypothetical protein [Thermodesulfobacteriota bacterium]
CFCHGHIIDPFIAAACHKPLLFFEQHFLKITIYRENPDILDWGLVLSSATFDSTHQIAMVNLLNFIVIFNC